MEEIEIRLDAAEAAALRQLAEEAGVDVGTLVRGYVRASLAFVAVAGKTCRDAIESAMAEGEGEGH